MGQLAQTLSVLILSAIGVGVAAILWAMAAEIFLRVWRGY